MIAAIIDLGSNSARMDIVEIFENGEYEYKERPQKAGQAQRRHGGGRLYTDRSGGARGRSARPSSKA